MIVAFIAINSGGTMGHMSIIACAANRLWQYSKTECVVMSDSQLDFSCFDMHHKIISVQLPANKHQFSVAGCIQEAPINEILKAVKMWNCTTVVFSTFFSVETVSTLIDHGIKTVLLTFPLRDSHWEMFYLRRHQDLFKQILVFADLYQNSRTMPNQIHISPLSDITPHKHGKKTFLNKVLVLVGGGGRPSADILYKLAKETMHLFDNKSVALSWHLSLGAKSKHTNKKKYWLEWKPSLGGWISDYDIIISEAGFNTTTELLSLGVPAILVPGYRRIDNQELRATNYELHGCGICILPEQGSSKLAEAIYQFLNSNEMLSTAAHKSIDTARRLANNPSLEEVIIE